MAKKSRQHIIPRVYLKSFCDDTPPAGHPAGAPFDSVVWIIQKNLGGTPLSKAPKNILFERNAYTLRTDRPSDPVIEEWLSGVETKYGRVLRKLPYYDDVNPTEWGDLMMFVGVLHARTLPQVALWQRQFGELENITRMVERAHTDREEYSDSQFVGWDEVGKRSIKDRTEIFAKSMSKGAIYLVENYSEIPFISSDAPTVLFHVFPETMRRWHVPEELIRNDVDPSTRAFFCFCALTPTLAIIGSHLLGVPGELRRYDATNNTPLVTWLVWLTINSADSCLLAHTAKPFPDFLTKAFRESLHLASSLNDDTETYVRLVNPTSQFKIEAFDVRDESEGPVSVLRFRTSDIGQLWAAASVGSFVECEVQINGGEQSRWMRNVRFLSVASSTADDSVLRQQL